MLRLYDFYCSRSLPAAFPGKKLFAIRSFNTKKVSNYMFFSNNAAGKLRLQFGFDIKHIFRIISIKKQKNLKKQFFLRKNKKSGTII